LELGESKYDVDELKASYSFVNSISTSLMDPEEHALIDDVKSCLAKYIDVLGV
jgi:hypothetical protein